MSDTSDPVTGSATTTIDAPIGDVFAAVTDVTRMGEWSPECVGCRWIDGAGGPAVGARFEGDNVARVGPITVKMRDGAFEARYEPALEVPERLELHVARLGFELVTAVRAGENTGRTLEHGFVVLGWTRHPMARTGNGFAATGDTKPFRWRVGAFTS